jgi:peptide/nickel transport system substrate-binding protein
MRKFHVLLLGTAAAALVGGAAWSADLNIGVQTEPSAIDPHFHNNPWTLMVMQHFFGTITEQDEKQRIVPGLAEKWELIDDNTWEFKLRSGVTFQDGSPLTVDDILFTVERSQDVPGSPTNTGRFLTLSGKKYSKIDDLTFQVATENPYPTMASDLSVTHIISEKNGKGATTADYASGKATIGTGPYKFTEWLRGDRVVMEANPNFWAGKPKWDKVTLKTLASGPTRVAGLLSGTVDVIDNVPTEDIETLKGNAKVNVFIEPSSRVIWMRLDMNRDLSPDVKTMGGEVMFPNPLRDWRVRRALAKAIDRDAMVSRVMSGSAIPAGQYIPPGSHGHNPDLKPEPYDPEGAKKLLADAGYGDGFQLVVTSADNRYPNDTNIVEAIAQNLNRIGIKATVRIVPSQGFPSRTRDGEFSFAISSWGSNTGDGADILYYGFHSFRPDLKLGGANFLRNINRRLDEAVRPVVNEMDFDERERMIRDAFAITVNDVGGIPVHWQGNIVATRKDLKIQVRADQWILAENVTKM